LTMSAVTATMILGTTLTMSAMTATMTLMWLCLSYSTTNGHDEKQ
jgi:hypothetical protein